MDDTLLKAILSMDSYNRGYNAGIDLTAFLNVRDAEDNLVSADTPNLFSLGTATIIGNSTLAFGAGIDESKGFYAAAYQYAGQVTISYRGTDELLGWDGDIWNGYGPGGGLPVGAFGTGQAELSLQFYQAIYAQSTNISVTGHSLGGGLAGLVGDLYNTSGILFDNMAYQLSASATHTLATLPPVSGTDFYADYRAEIYGFLSAENPIPYNDPAIPVNNYAGLTAYVLEGQFLTADILLQGGAKFMVPLDSNISEIGSGITGGGRHSMATLAIKLFSYETEASEYTHWQAAEKYFWPVLYEDDFANVIGISQLQGTSKASDKLRNILAYSAIDGTEEGSTTLFGDTGIRALYNDADNLGEAISLENSSSTLAAYGKDIGRVLVEYAGKLALNQILYDDDATVISGALSFSDIEDDHTLTIDFNWSFAGTEIYDIKSKSLLIQSLLDGTEASENASIGDSIAGEMARLWDDADGSSIDKVIFVTQAGKTTIGETATDDDANIIVGSAGTDVLTGTNGRELILLDGGDDEVHANGGADIIYGGAGQNLIYAGAGDDFIFGSIKHYVSPVDPDELAGNIIYGGDANVLISEDGADAISYAHVDFGILAEINSSTEGRAGRWLTGNITWGNEDKLFSIEKFALTAHDDKFLLSGNSAHFIKEIDGGAQDEDGKDLLDGTSSTVGFTLNIDISDEVVLTDGIAISNFEDIKGSANQKDVFRVSDGTHTIDGGAGGGDTIDYSYAHGGMEVNLAAGTGQTADPINDTLISIENAVGSIFNDTLEGDSGDNTLAGNLGSDEIKATGGKDVYYGDALGAKGAFGSTDDDTLDLTALTDPLYINANSFARIADYTANFAGAYSNNPVAQSSFYYGFEKVNLGAGDDTIVAAPQPGASVERSHIVYDMGGGTDTVQLGNDNARVFKDAEGKSHLVTSSGMEIINFENIETPYGFGADIGKGYLASVLSIEDLGNTIHALWGSYSYLDYSGYDEGLTFSFNPSDFSQQTVTNGTDTDTINNGQNNVFIMRYIGTDHGDTYNFTTASGASSGDGDIWLGQGNDTITAGLGHNFYYSGGDKTINRASFTFPTIILDPSIEASDISLSIANVRQITDIWRNDYRQPDLVTYHYDLIVTIKDKGTLTFVDVAKPAHLNGGNYGTVNDLVNWDYLPFSGGFVPTPPKIQLSDGDPVDVFSSGIPMVSDTGTIGFSYGYFGTPGDDAISHSGWLMGGDGDDTLTGLQSTNTLDGEAGNDVLIAGNNGPALFGGFGDDTITGGDGNDIAHGGFGNDTVTGGAGDDLVYGEDGNDLLEGGAGGDTLAGGAGDDSIDGGTGNDLLYGNQGADIFNIAAGTGADVIGDYNRAEGDVINFTDSNLALENIGVERDGNDLKLGGDGYSVTLTGFFLNFLSGAGTSEVLARFQGGSPVALVIDGEGNLQGVGQNPATNLANNIAGDASDETLSALGGDDTVSGGLGTNTLLGGSGNDNYFFVYGNDTIIESDDSTGSADKISFDAGVALADLSMSRNGDDLQIDVAQGGSITISNQFGHGTRVEQLVFDDASTFDLTTLDAAITGTSGDDTLVGNDVVNFIEDVLQGLGGNDTLSGGLGDDRMEGGAGDDVFNVTAGADTVNDTSGADKIVFGAAYNPADISYAVNGTSLDIFFNGVLTAHIENQFTQNGQIETFQFDDASTIALSSVQFAQQGTSGDDAIAGFSYGGSIHNLVFGEEGADTLTGGAGDDTLDGGLGNDVLDGGTDNDTYIVNSGLDTVVDSGGVDTIEFGAGYALADMSLVRVNGSDLEVSFNAAPAVHISGFFNAGSGIETIVFDDASTFDLSAYHEVTGTAGNDTLAGLDNALLPDDVIYGLAGEDTLQGGLGDDLLQGGNDSDTYIYDSGLDAVLDSGGSADRVVFAAGYDIGDMTLARNGLTGLDILFNGVLAVQVTGQFTAGGGIETLEFADSSTVDLSSASFTTSGTSGDDVLYGIDIAGVADVIEQLDEGTDTVQASLDYALTANVENLILAGTGNIDGTGNTLNNVITGNAGNNILTGNDGDDILAGGGGLDTLWGNLGADTFVFEAATAYNNIDVIKDFSTSQGDVIDISDLLTGYDSQTMNLTDFVDIADAGSDSALRIDRDGAGTTFGFVQVATIQGVTGLTDEAQLMANGNLLVG